MKVLLLFKRHWILVSLFPNRFVMPVDAMRRLYTYMQRAWALGLNTSLAFLQSSVSVLCIYQQYMQC